MIQEKYRSGKNFYSCVILDNWFHIWAAVPWYYRTLLHHEKYFTDQPKLFETAIQMIYVEQHCWVLSWTFERKIYYSLFSQLTCDTLNDKSSLWNNCHSLNVVFSHTITRNIYLIKHDILPPTTYGKYFSPQKVHMSSICPDFDKMFFHACFQVFSNIIRSRVLSRNRVHYVSVNRPEHDPWAISWTSLDTSPSNQSIVSNEILLRDTIADTSPLSRLGVTARNSKH